MNPAIYAALALAACSAPMGAALTYTLSDPELVSYSAGWGDLGIVATPDGEIVITVERVPDLVVDGVRTQGASFRDTDTILIDSALSGFRLAVAVAHEVGHIVLDTPRHTHCGIMGGEDTQLCDEDRALACQQIPYLWGCP